MGKIQGGLYTYSQQWTNEKLFDDDDDDDVSLPLKVRNKKIIKKK